MKTTQPMGRPPIPPDKRAVKIHASIPPDFHAWLLKRGYGSVSAGLRRAWDVVKNKC